MADNCVCANCQNGGRIIVAKVIASSQNTLGCLQFLKAITIIMGDANHNMQTQQCMQGKSCGQWQDLTLNLLLVGEIVVAVKTFQSSTIIKACCVVFTPGILDLNAFETREVEFERT